MVSYSREDLIELIKELTGLEELTPFITKQISKYILDYSMNFKEIARCLVYWVEVKKQPLKPEYGIGIVPHIKEEANKYFKQLERQKTQQIQEAQKIIEFEDNDIIFCAPRTKKVKPKFKLLDINEIKVKGEEDINNE